MEEIGIKVKELRLSKAMTLKELSAKSDLSVGFLSQVERGASSLAITSLKKIADALGVKMTYFFEDEHVHNYAVKHEDQKIIGIKGSETQYIRLSGDFIDRQLECMRVTLGPNYVGKELFSHTGEEFYYILEGAIKFKVAGKEYFLNAGESIHFPSEKPHQWENPLDRHSTLLSVITPVIF
ncbi:cupin domain-containing protein [Siminovitchia sp. 179-K 8D1 HS]|uniref:cupin domain-containing protein n=1 Tax=Siminovitchia sp. 179-K 8D1 HS TaxID=3142385 RepID=UPI00399EEC5C